MQTLRLLILAAMAGLLAGCFASYKMDIRQGNVITPEMVAQIQPGMPKRQVQHLLGTPLVVDTFHQERWDYYYSFKKGGESKVEQRRLTLYFDKDVLARMEGDAQAQGAAPAPTAGNELKPDEAVVVKSGADANTPAAKEEKGFFRRMWDKVWN